jgi:hypothetical protein
MLTQQFKQNYHIKPPLTFNHKTMQKLTRQRTQGNFLFDIYSSSKLSVQALLKERLNQLTKEQELRDGKAIKDNWENFQRTQTHVNKKSGYDAEIIGICVKTLITDVLIMNDGTLTDLQKLYAFWAEVKQDMEIESMV